MPHVNLFVLHDTLNRLQMRLYDIYLTCNNNEIAEAILSERDFIITMMEQIQEIL
jgi:hypothetical protein